MIAAVQRTDSERLSADAAVTAAENLTGFYPKNAINNPELFATALSAMLAQYPPRVVEKVCDPLTGLPSRLKWCPTLAEVKAALEQERSALRCHYFVADWMLREHKRREDEAAAQITEEERERRRQKVEEILAAVRSKGEAAE